MTRLYVWFASRSQAVARIADRTASATVYGALQILWYCFTAPLGSRDVIGHVTILIPHRPLLVLWNGSLSLQPFPRYCALGVLRLQAQYMERSIYCNYGFDLSGSCNVIGRVSHVTIWYPYTILFVVLGTKPLSPTVSVIFNVDVTQWCVYLDTTSKQRSRSFILVPIDFSITTSYRQRQITSAILKHFRDVQHLWWTTGAGRHTVNLDVHLAAKEVQLFWCNNWVVIHWKYVEIKSQSCDDVQNSQRTDRNTGITVPDSRYSKYERTL